MSCGSTHMEVHVLWKHTSESTHVDCTQLTHNKLFTKSIALHYTNILLVYEYHRCHTSSLQYHTYKDLMKFFSGAQKFWVKYRVVLWIKLMYHVTNIKLFYCLSHVHGVNRRRSGKWPLWENYEMFFITNRLLLN